MRILIDQIKRFLYEQDGPTAVEYAIMVSLIAGVVVLGATQLGLNTSALFQTALTAMGGA